jgi:phosphoribosylaminoimidazole (AIR) synthetase
MDPALHKVQVEHSRRGAFDQQLNVVPQEPLPYMVISITKGIKTSPVPHLGQYRLHTSTSSDALAFLVDEGLAVGLRGLVVTVYISSSTPRQQTLDAVVGHRHHLGNEASCRQGMWDRVRWLVIPATHNVKALGELL